jgi:PAS domain S-box-containing protein
VSQGRTAVASAAARFGRGRAGSLLPPTLTWILVSYALLLLASGWTYSLLRIRTDREQTLNAQRNQLSLVAVALETGTLAMLNDGLGAARTAANEIAAAGGLDAAGARALRTNLERVLRSGAYVRSVFLADAGRFARAGESGDYQVSQTLPEWFTAPQGTDTDVWLGRPIPDPARARDTVIPVAHRVPLARGGSLWAGALFSFNAFEPLRAQLAGPGGMIGLLSTDGVMLLAIQDPGGATRPVRAGISYATSPLFRAAPLSTAAGLVEGYAPSLGVRMVIAYVRLRSYPVTVLTGMPLDSILAAWRERTRTTLIVTAVPTALVVALTVALYHFLTALRRRELHYRTLFNNAAFGVLLLEGDRFVAANDTAVRMFGLESQDSFCGATPWMLSPERQPDGRPSDEAARERIEEARRRGGTTFEWQHKRLDSGVPFPAEVDLATLGSGRSSLTLAVVHDLTERKRAEQERHESEERYRALVDALPEAVFVHRGQELLFGNDAALQLIGAHSAADIAGRSVLTFLDPADREHVTERTRQILEQGTTAPPREVRVWRLDGTPIWVEVRGVRIQFAGAPAVQSVMHDITARKLAQDAEAARHERVERQSATLLELASRADAGADALGSALLVICRSAAEALRLERCGVWLLEDEEASLRCVQSWTRGERPAPSGMRVPAAELGIFLAALASERVIVAADIARDARLTELRADRGWPIAGTQAALAAAIRRSGEITGVLLLEQMERERVWQPDEVSFAGGVADRVAQALVDAQREEVLADLRSLAGELTRTQDEERRRVGRDLHDSTGQTLAALELNLGRLAHAASTLAPEQGGLLAESVRLAKQCAAEIRTASYLLHPPLLDELGLLSALKWLADGLRQRGGIEVQLELPSTMARLPAEEELTLFRVAQEALTNVHRHAASPWAALRLRVAPEEVTLEVEDRGRGIASRERARMGPERARIAAGEPSLGVGLAGMRERVRQVGGSFLAESTGSGTRISARVPLRVRPDARRA